MKQYYDIPTFLNKYLSAVTKLELIVGFCDGMSFPSRIFGHIPVEKKHLILYMCRIYE